MGTEVSLQKNRQADEMYAYIPNNYRPLQFHYVHGENVKLLKNGKVACRPEGFCKGLAFSDRPVAIHEPILIKFVDVSNSWSGALRIGFTAHDPVAMRTKLPRYACPDLTVLSGNWAKAVAERLVQKDAILFYYVNSLGDVHYGINDVELGIFFGGVDTTLKLWAVFDIYGNTVAIEFIDPHTLYQNNNRRNEPIVSSTSRESRNRSEEILSEVRSSVSFHIISWFNIRSSREIIYKFIERPLILEEKIFIKIVKADCPSINKFYYGVTSCDPKTLTSRQLPEDSYWLMDRPEYWVVDEERNQRMVGEVMTYCLTSEGKLCVSKDGSAPVVAFHADQTLPLWLFFNITDPSFEITLVGSSGEKSSHDLSASFSNLSVQSSTDRGISEKESSECKICFEEPADTAIYRCGHTCMCHSCASKLFKSMFPHCPICRKPIQDIIKIYK